MGGAEGKVSGPFVGLFEVLQLTEGIRLPILVHALSTFISCL